VCNILDGNIPAAVEEIGQAVLNEVEGDYSSVTAFIKSLPSLVPPVLEDIVHDGEDVVGLVETLFEDPGAAVSIIVSDVVSVVTEVETEVKSIWSDVTCFFGGCHKTNKQGAWYTISSSCVEILQQAAVTTSNQPAAATQIETTAQASPAAAAATAHQSSYTTMSTSAAVPASFGASNKGVSFSIGAMLVLVLLGLIIIIVL